MEPLRLFLKTIYKSNSIALLIAPIVFFSFAPTAYSEEDAKKGSTDTFSSNNIATKADTFLYRQIGVNILCRARLAEIEFPKALGISAATFADVILQKHGGAVEEMPGKKLTAKQLYLSAEVQILEGAIKFCPDSVPEEAKKKFSDFVDRQKSKK